MLLNFTFYLTFNNLIEDQHPLPWSMFDNSITMLTLMYKLIGQIPASLGQLSNLAEVCLDHNQLSGKSPLTA